MVSTASSRRIPSSLPPVTRRAWLSTLRISTRTINAREKTSHVICAMPALATTRPILLWTIRSVWVFVLFYQSHRCVMCAGLSASKILAASSLLFVFCVFFSLLILDRCVILRAFFYISWVCTVQFRHIASVRIVCKYFRGKNQKKCYYKVTSLKRSKHLLVNSEFFLRAEPFRKYNFMFYSTQIFVVSLVSFNCVLDVVGVQFVLLLPSKL